MGTNKAEEYADNKYTKQAKEYAITSSIRAIYENCIIDFKEGYNSRQSEIDELTNEVERLRKESEWISIKDELPIIGKGFKHFSDDVLCLLIDESCTVTFYDYELKKWNLRPHSYEVTHWKPLPPIHGSIPSLSTII